MFDMHHWQLSVGAFPHSGFSLFLPLILAWSMVWKGLALWHAAKRGEAIWFIVFMVVHTAGIIELIYLLTVARVDFSSLFSSSPKRKR